MPGEKYPARQSLLPQTPYITSSAARYATKLTSHATATWNAAAPSIHRQLPVSFLMVARVAAQGIYSSEKVINARALAGPKPMPLRMADRLAMPAAEFTLFTLNSTAQLETTTSLADTPAISATTICQ